jgi:hypothetical protein
VKLKEATLSGCLVDFARVTARLKRCLDTKREFSHIVIPDTLPIDTTKGKT